MKIKSNNFSTFLIWIFLSDKNKNFPPGVYKYEKIITPDDCLGKNKQKINLLSKIKSYYIN